MAVYTQQVSDFLLRKDATRRPLDWRFQRSVKLSHSTSRRRYPRNGDDDLVMRYADLLHRLHEHAGFNEFDRVKKRHPDLIEVHCIYADMNQTELALLDGLLLSQSVDPDLIRRQSGMTEVQQILYRRMFLDIEGRRDMTTFISSQLMEPARLRGSALDTPEKGKPESLDNIRKQLNHGSLSLRSRCVLRIMGFYSSPIVLELLYTGFLAGTIPGGRDSAVRFMTQGLLTQIRRGGLFATAELVHDSDSITELLKMAGKLAMEEKEEGQIEIMENVDAFFRESRPRVGLVTTILKDDRIPDVVFTGPYEYTDEEIIEARLTGKVPPAILALTEHTKIWE